MNDDRIEAMLMSMTGLTRRMLGIRSPSREFGTAAHEAISQATRAGTRLRLAHQWDALISGTG